MSEKASGTPLKRKALAQLRNPIRLRFLVCAALLASWYFGFYGPTNEQITLTSARAESEQKRAAIAHQIEALRATLSPYQVRIPEHWGQNELNQYVLEHVRQSPLKIIDLRPIKTRDLGAFDNIGMRLQMEGSYENLDGFLRWVENDIRLLRIDTLRVDPAKDGRLNVQVDLLCLAEKEKTGPAPDAATSARPEARR